MYSIARVIFGIPLNETNGVDAPIAPPLNDDEIKELENLEPPIFLRYYSGAADESPIAIGVQLSEFDDATDYITELSSIPHEATAEQKAEYMAGFVALPAPIKLKLTTPPRVFILWSTS